jgi:hypothetical protein
MAPIVTRRDHGTEIGELEQMLSHRTVQASMSVLELENRCTGNRAVGSNPTLSAIDSERSQAIAEYHALLSFSAKGPSA